MTIENYARVHLFITLQASAGMNVNTALKSVYNLLTLRKEYAKRILSARNDEEFNTLVNAYSSIEDQIKGELAIL